MKKSIVCSHIVCFLVGVFGFALSGQYVSAQEVESRESGPRLIAPEDDSQQSETVTINVKDANISEVLKAYSLQTGQSIVVGPDVISENVNVRLNNIPWQEALDVILKPYGFGYRVVGGTIVVSKLENIVQVEGIEPLVSKVFSLKYLDAYDVRDVCAAQLTARGKITILSNKGLPGWEFGGGSSGGVNKSRSGSSIGTATRKKEDPIEKSKTIIVTDVPSAITAIGTILEELDQVPSQVLIESRFIEINTGVLQDFGVDFATGVDGLDTPGVQVSNEDANNRWGVEQNDATIDTPAAFDPVTEALTGAMPFNSGLQLLFSRVAGENFEVMLHALEEDGDAKVLSAPQILTLDNQEAAILVGTKYPIIESNASGGGSSSATISTSLDYYESIGIQLNVIPQVSDKHYINMIVHPVVSEIEKFVQGVVLNTGGDEKTPLTDYPVLKVREAQTQILLKSGDSVVIGGLQNELEKKSEHKVPLLGDIPFLGHLFKRTTTGREKIELLIFLKATIIDAGAYAEESEQLKNDWENRIGFKSNEEELEEELIEPAEEAVMEAEEPVAVEVDVTQQGMAVEEEVLTSEKEELVSFISGTSATEESAAASESNM